MNTAAVIEIYIAETLEYLSLSKTITAMNLTHVHVTLIPTDTSPCFEVSGAQMVR